MAIPAIKDTVFHVQTRREAIEVIAAGATNAIHDHSANPLIYHAASELIMRDDRGQKTDIRAVGLPHQVLAQVSCELHQLGVSYFASSQIMEALEGYTIGLGADFAREAQAKPLYARVMVTDKKPDDIPECELVQTTLIDGERRVGDGVGQRVMQSTIYGTRTSMTRELNLDEMFASSRKKWLMIYYGSPSDETFKGLDDVDVPLINVAQGLGGYVSQQVIDDIQTAVQNGEASPTLLDMVDDFAKVQTVLEEFKGQAILPVDVQAVVQKLVTKIDNGFHFLAQEQRGMENIVPALGNALTNINNSYFHPLAELNFVKPPQSSRPDTAANDGVYRKKVVQQKQQAAPALKKAEVGLKASSAAVVVKPAPTPKSEAPQQVQVQQRQSAPAPKVESGVERSPAATVAKVATSRNEAPQQVQGQQRQSAPVPRVESGAKPNPAVVVAKVVTTPKGEAPQQSQGQQRQSASAPRVEGGAKSSLVAVVAKVASTPKGEVTLQGQGQQRQTMTAPRVESGPKPSPAAVVAKVATSRNEAPQQSQVQQRQSAPAPRVESGPKPSPAATVAKVVPTPRSEASQQGQGQQRQAAPAPRADSLPSRPNQRPPETYIPQRQDSVVKPDVQRMEVRGGQPQMGEVRSHIPTSRPSEIYVPQRQAGVVKSDVQRIETKFVPISKDEQSHQRPIQRPQEIHIPQRYDGVVKPDMQRAEVRQAPILREDMQQQRAIQRVPETSIPQKIESFIRPVQPVVAEKPPIAPRQEVYQPRLAPQPEIISRVSSGLSTAAPIVSNVNLSSVTETMKSQAITKEDSKWKKVLDKIVGGVKACPMGSAVCCCTTEARKVFSKPVEKVSKSFNHAAGCGCSDCATQKLGNANDLNAFLNASPT